MKKIMRKRTIKKSNKNKLKKILSFKNIFKLIQAFILMGCISILDKSYLIGYKENYLLAISSLGAVFTQYVVFFTIHLMQSRMIDPNTYLYRKYTNNLKTVLLFSWAIFHKTRLKNVFNLSVFIQLYACLFIIHYIKENICSKTIFRKIDPFIASENLSKCFSNMSFANIFVFVVTIFITYVLNNLYLNIKIFYSHNDAPHHYSKLPIKIHSGNSLILGYAVHNYLINYFKSDEVYGAMFRTFITTFVVFSGSYLNNKLFNRANMIAENLNQSRGFVDKIKPGAESESFIAKKQNEALLIDSLILVGIINMEHVTRFPILTFCGLSNSIIFLFEDWKENLFTSQFFNYAKK